MGLEQGNSAYQGEHSSSQPMKYSSRLGVMSSSVLECQNRVCLKQTKKARKANTNTPLKTKSEKCKECEEYEEKNFAEFVQNFVKVIQRDCKY